MDTTADRLEHVRTLAPSTGDEKHQESSTSTLDAFGTIGVPKRFVHDYGSWAEIDAGLGIDERGIRGRLEALIG